MGPRKFKKMLDQIPRLTPVQKQRLMHGVQTSVRCDELPEPVRQREAELDPIASMYALRFLRGGASREVGRLVSISLPFGIVRTNLSRADWAPSCWLEAPVEGVDIRSVFARSADAASVSRAMRDRLPNRILVAASLAWQAAERLETPRHRGDGRDLLSGDLESCKGDCSLTERRLASERGGNRGHWGLVSDQRPCLDGSVKRRADLYGSPPIDSGDEHRSGNVGPKMACVSPMDIPATPWQAGA